MNGRTANREVYLWLAVVAGACLAIALAGLLFLCDDARADVQVVVRATDNTWSTDPGRIMAGMAVDCYPVGKFLGKGISLPDFWIVTVTGISLGDATSLMLAQEKATGTFRRRAYRLDQTKLTTALRNTLLTTGRVTLTKAQAQNAVVSVP